MLICDLQHNDFSQKLVWQLKNIGFAIISNHQIETQLFQQVKQEWNNFFKSKLKYNYLHNTQSMLGYFAAEKAKDQQIADIKEFYHLGAKNNLPNNISKSSLILRDKLGQLAIRLLKNIDNSTLNWSDSLNNIVDLSGNTVFRIIYHPPHIENTLAKRAAAHEDINLLTLLPVSDEPGFEMRDLQGNWHQPNYGSHDIIVMIGDMLQEFTNSYYQATTHRVNNPTGKYAKLDCHATPFFVHPYENTILSKNYTAKQFLYQRLNEQGLL